MERNVVIIGSGAAGLTAAIYASRANLSPLLVDGAQPGGQLTITSDVENFPGYTDPVEGPFLMEQMRGQAARVGTEFLAGSVTAVDIVKPPFTIDVDGKKITTKTLIVATGASAMWLGIESEKRLMGKGVSACATCDGFFFKGKVVAVIGGGDTALEEATFLTRFVSKVTIVHRRNEFRASKAMQDRAKSNPKIEFIWNSVVEEIQDKGTGVVTGLLLKNIETGERKELSCEGVFVAIGHKPNTEFFKGKLEMDKLGYIVTKRLTMETSVPGVFAAGDCQDHIYRQAVTAAGTGCMAAMDAERYLQR